jgi:cytochrome c
MKVSMKHVLLGALVLGCAIIGITCSSNSKTASSGGTGGAGGAATGAVSNNGGATGCANSVLEIVFSPMYSAFDGVHQFQIPAVANVTEPSAVTWSASDPSMVQLAPDTDTGGVMITVQKSGSVTIIASAGGACGASILAITPATPDDWSAGNTRYNDGVVITSVSRGTNTRDAAADANSQQAACTNCHGPTASGPYKTVAHTPEQAGGFSDQQLEDIFLHGTVPDGGYFDPSIVSYAAWQTFHKWEMTDAEVKGVVVYLRSLTPTAQTGSSNFGNRLTGAGGNRGGGGARGGGPRGGGGAGGAGTGGAAGSATGAPGGADGGVDTGAV